MAALLTALALFQHRENIKRLIRGEERKTILKKTKKDGEIGAAMKEKSDAHTAEKEEIIEEVKEEIEEIKEKVEEVIEDIQEKAEDIADEVKERMEENVLKQKEDN